MEDRIKNDLKRAMLARDGLKVSTLRMLASEISYAKIQKGQGFSENDIIPVIKKEAKKRREAIQSYTNANRLDSAENEQKELEILESYLPEEISDSELTKIVEEAINKTGAVSIQDLGRVMSDVMGKVGNQADGSRVSSLVKQKLS